MCYIYDFAKLSSENIMNYCFISNKQINTCSISFLFISIMNTGSYGFPYFSNPLISENCHDFLKMIAKCFPFVFLMVSIQCYPFPRLTTIQGSRNQLALPLLFNPQLSVGGEDMNSRFSLWKLYEMNISDLIRIWTWLTYNCYTTCTSSISLWTLKYQMFNKICAWMYFLKPGMLSSIYK